LAFPKPFYRWRPHPWHGLETGPEPPGLVNAYIELTPFDVVKYEIDKVTGLLSVDRPQRGSSSPPALYGLIPRTYCGDRVGALCDKAERGDGDPMDICVISERPINRAEVIVRARVVGGLQMIDNGEADDKIVAVLDKDFIWGGVCDVSELPSALTERLEHYFSTYKWVPGQDAATSIERVYGRDHALEVIKASIADYEHEFGS
jgi:inorganic pyrophosphatase